MNEYLGITRRDVLLGLALAVALPGLELASRADDKKPDADKGQDQKPEVKKYHGYGAAATGGAGHPTVEVKSYEELKEALEAGNATIIVKAKEIWIPEKLETTASNITLDGQGATLRGDKIKNRSMQMLKFVKGRNLIVKNIHLRNGGDNIAFYQGAKDIVLDHVSSTGAGDGGISISNDSQNATVTHCFVAGNTRGIFCKYGKTSRITIDHCIIMKLWMRAPLLDQVPEFDVRNNLIQEWGTMAVRLSGEKTVGNVMGNLFIKKEGTRGLDRRSIVFENKTPPGAVFIADNEFRNCEEKKIKSNTNKPLQTPPIVPAYTTDLQKLEKYLLSDTAGAGCMPRDVADRMLIKAKKWYNDHDVPFRIPETDKPLPEKEPDDEEAKDEESLRDKLPEKTDK